MKTFQEVCDRYNIKKSALSLFVKAHRNEIDPDRTHLSKDGRIVFFDEYAVAMMDKIRGYISNLSEFRDVPMSDPEIIKLQRENIELKDEIIKQLREKNEMAAKLADVQQKVAVLLTANQNYMAQLENADRRLQLIGSRASRRGGNRWWR